MFRDIGAPTDIHSFCPECHAELNTTTNCSVCGKSLSEVTVPFFITVDIEHQLSTILRKPGNWNDVKTYRFKDREPGVIRDIYDGIQYRSLLLNTDGVPIFRSSPSSL